VSKGVTGIRRRSVVKGIAGSIGIIGLSTVSSGQSNSNFDGDADAGMLPDKEIWEKDPFDPDNEHSQFESSVPPLIGIVGYEYDEMAEFRPHTSLRFYYKSRINVPFNRSRIYYDSEETGIRFDDLDRIDVDFVLVDDGFVYCGSVDRLTSDGDLDQYAKRVVHDRVDPDSEFDVIYEHHHGLFPFENTVR
jgi:hypothetical protein